MKKDQDNIQLSKVKLVKGGGLEVHYTETVREGDITDKVNWITKNTINPHPDLVKKVNELKDYLARCYGFNGIKVLMDSKQLKPAEQKAFGSVSTLIYAMVKETMKKIDITGVAIAGEIDGEKDKRSVVITGTMLQENNVKTALNSPRLKMNQDLFKFESDVKIIIDDLEDEVFAYLFENKKAQLGLFDEPKEAVAPLGENFKAGKLKKVEEQEEAA